MPGCGPAPNLAISSAFQTVWGSWLQWVAAAAAAAAVVVAVAGPAIREMEAHRLGLSLRRLPPVPHMHQMPQMPQMQPADPRPMPVGERAAPPVAGIGPSPSPPAEWWAAETSRDDRHHLRRSPRGRIPHRMIARAGTVKSQRRKMAIVRQEELSCREDEKNSPRADS